MNATSSLQINLSRLEQNLAAFRSLVAHPDRFIDRQPAICVVIKANAYGLGAVPIAKRLMARGVDMLAVYSPMQAEELVRNAVTSPILLLMPLRAMSRSDALYRHAAAGLLHLSIHDPQQLAEINHFSQMLGLKMPVHLYHDTGMSRSGLNRQEMVDVLAALPEMAYVRLAGIFTHLASAGSNEAAAQQQLEQFEQLLDEQAELIGPEVTIHVGNTFATLRDRRFHRDMVRIGLGVYGYGPDLLTEGSIIGEMEPIEPTLRWTTKLVHVARYPKGTPVGYDATHTLWRESVLGLVPVGYGDGYPTSLSNKAVVCLPRFRTGPDHATAAVVGKVSMEQMVVDLTDIAATIEGQRRRSDDRTALAMLTEAEVELISDDPTSPCSLPRIAAAAGTSCYEQMCRIAPHVPRRYVTVEPADVTDTAEMRMR